MPTFEQAISWLANFIQIGVFLFTIAVFWRARRRLATALAGLQQESTARPIALAVGLGNDIAAPVSSFLSSAGLSMPVHNYHRPGMVQREQFHQVLRDLLKAKQQLTDLGVTEVHLFYMGPVTLSIGVGAILDNWVPVKVYKYVEGRYELDFVLQKETVLGLLGQTLDAGADMLT